MPYFGVSWSILYIYNSTRIPEECIILLYDRQSPELEHLPQNTGVSRIAGIHLHPLLHAIYVGVGAGCSLQVEGLCGVPCAE